MTFVSPRVRWFITLLLLSTAVSTAQWRAATYARSFPERYDAPALLPGGENVFSPDQSSIFVSAFLGLNHNTNIGSFKTDCDCQFDGAFSLKNLGGLVGVDVTYQFHPSWAVMAKAYYDNKHTKESYERDIETPIKLGNLVVIRPVKYEESGAVSLSYFSFGLFGRWQPRLARWYVFVGPAIGIPFANSIQHDQAIMTPELSYQEIGISETKRTVSTADFKGSLRMEAMAGFGYDYIVRPRWYITPEIRVGYPVTKVTETVTDRSKEIAIPDWKVVSVQLSIGLKYEAF